MRGVTVFKLMVKLSPYHKVSLIYNPLPFSSLHKSEKMTDLLNLRLEGCTPDFSIKNSEFKFLLMGFSGVWSKTILLRLSSFGPFPHSLTHSLTNPLTSYQGGCLQLSLHGG